MSKNIILFDDDNWTKLLPFTFTRPVSEIRIGILTIREKWEYHLSGKASYITQDHLAEKYAINIEDDNIIINASFLPSPALIRSIEELNENEAVLLEDELIAARLNRQSFEKLNSNDEIEELRGIQIEQPDLIEQLIHPEDIFEMNGAELLKDFQLVTNGRTSQAISQTNRTIRADNIFIEEGASVEHAILNAEEYPIYIGKNTTILEGSMIRGGLALCENAAIKMGAKIYGPTTIGPGSKVAGELKNVVIFGNSNKGHEGYLGNSVIGEWCNLGADTNASNLKNNYAQVKLWDYDLQKFRQTDTRFCGLIMGDHSKCGINTMFNTGTVVGVSANIFGSGYPRYFIPSFSWGGSSGYNTYRLPKVFEVASIVMERKNQPLTETDKKILEYVFLQTSKHRVWEKPMNS